MAWQQRMMTWLTLTALGGIFAFTHHLDLSTLLDQVVERIAELGPYGYLLFAVVYVIAEILAVPAIPLTASSGYLFGLVPGTAIVLVSATIAAAISFLIGRTYLRTWAQGFISESPKWRAIDKAIAKQGFKVVLLLRLSPLLPFALSNYLYAVTSVDFLSFISATFLGFAPGSFGFVYFGSAGKSLFSGGAGLPWYAYGAIGLLLALFVQTIARVATDAVKHMEVEDDHNNNNNNVTVATSTLPTDDDNWAADRLKRSIGGPDAQVQIYSTGFCG
eukprot:gene4439-4863_t